MPTINVEIPEVFQALFKPKRYKTFFGGRGGAKSWAFADALILLMMQDGENTLCAREYQNSIDDSVHGLLKARIDALGLTDYFDVQNTVIYCKRGGYFKFTGLKRNIESLKSKFGYKRVWIEEAETVTDRTWKILIPTIREANSEIWISYNPELATSPTHQRFVAPYMPDILEHGHFEDDIQYVAKVTYRDNPFFDNTPLRMEMERDKATDYDSYLNVWEGHCKQTLDGAIYAKEIRRATEENRFIRVPYDESKPVHTVWDLGRADKTAIWFVQMVGFEYRIIDYYDNQGFALSHYVKELRTKPYIYGDCWLPHDAENELLGSDKTIAQQMRSHNFTVRIVPKLSINAGINAARTIFANCFFDSEKCVDGIECLRNYRYEVDPDTKTFSDKPLHDWASHGADAFRYMAIAMQQPKTTKRPAAKNTDPFMPQVGGWMR